MTNALHTFYVLLCDWFHICKDLWKVNKRVLNILIYSAYRYPSQDLKGSEGCTMCVEEYKIWSVPLSLLSLITFNFWRKGMFNKCTKHRIIIHVNRVFMGSGITQGQNLTTYNLWWSARHNFMITRNLNQLLNIYCSIYIPHQWLAFQLCRPHFR